VKWVVIDKDVGVQHLETCLSMVSDLPEYTALVFIDQIPLCPRHDRKEYIMAGGAYLLSGANDPSGLREAFDTYTPLDNQVVVLSCEALLLGELLTVLDRVRRYLRHCSRPPSTLVLIIDRFLVDQVIDVYLSIEGPMPVLSDSTAEFRRLRKRALQGRSSRALRFWRRLFQSA
jgi:hypothetical protein